MARAEQSSLRFSRIEKRRLTAMLLISLAIHILAWGGYEAGNKFGWGQKLHKFLQAHKLEKKTPPSPKTPPPETEPQIFVSVSEFDPTPPKNAKYYSQNNSHAAQPDEDKHLNQPKLDGKQKLVPKTETVPKFSKLQPASPPPQPPTKPAPETKPETQPAEASPATSPLNKGDVKLAKKTSEKKTEEKKTKDEKIEKEKAEAKKIEEQKKAPPQPQQPQTPPRPRTLNQVLAERHLPGLQSQQNGGAQRHLSPSFDAKMTPFGAYDNAIITAVTQHWYNLLDSQQFAQDRTGYVTVKFNLYADGRVDQVTVLKTTVGELLSYVCQSSILQSAPFGPWPDDMRRMIGENVREITFTFYYY